MTVLNELKYNNDINQKRAYAASDTADEKFALHQGLTFTSAVYTW